MGLVAKEGVLGESLSARSGLAPGEVAAGVVTALRSSPRGRGLPPPTGVARGQLSCWWALHWPLQPGLPTPGLPPARCLHLSAPRAPSSKPRPAGAPSPERHGFSQPIPTLQTHLQSHQRQPPGLSQAFRASPWPPRHGSEHDLAFQLTVTVIFQPSQELLCI